MIEAGTLIESIYNSYINSP
jgi:hypothetical protein